MGENEFNIRFIIIVDRGVVTEPQNVGPGTCDFGVERKGKCFLSKAGSNQLIQDGARVALNPDDVLLQIKQDHIPSSLFNGKPVLLLSDEQSKIYPYITYQPVHVDELVRQSGLSISSLMNITLSLELKRAIRQLPGQYYVRNENG